MRWAQTTVATAHAAELRRLPQPQGVPQHREDSVATDGAPGEALDSHHPHTTQVSPHEAMRQQSAANSELFKPISSGCCCEAVRNPSVKSETVWWECSTRLTCLRLCAC